MRFNYKDFIQIILTQNKWWVTTMLISTILIVFIILYLIKYETSEFIYSLF